MERDAAFEHAKSKTVISMPQPNGTVYTFGKDVNILWRHGILQVMNALYPFIIVHVSLSERTLTVDSNW